MIRGMETPPMNTGWESWGYSTRKRESSGTPYSTSSTLKGAYKRAERDFLQEYV